MVKSNNSDEIRFSIKTISTTKDDRAVMFDDPVQEHYQNAEMANNINSGSFDQIRPFS